MENLNPNKNSKTLSNYSLFTDHINSLTAISCYGGEKKIELILSDRYVPCGGNHTQVRMSSLKSAEPSEKSKTSASSYFIYVGIICDPSIEFIINRLLQNKSMMANMASAIDVPFGRWRSYDKGAFLCPLGTPLRIG